MVSKWRRIDVNSKSLLRHVPAGMSPEKHGHTLANYIY